MRAAGLALAALLAGCAAPSPPPPETPRWELGRVPGPPPACYVRVVGEAATQDFIQRADGIALFVLSARGATTLQALSGDRPPPPVGAPFQAGPDQVPLGQVIESNERRLAVRLASPAMLRAMLDRLASRARAGEAAPATGTTAEPPPDLAAQLDRCLAPLQPTGVTTPS